MIETNAITTLKQIPKKNLNRIFLIDSNSEKQIQYKGVYTIILNKIGLNILIF